MPTALLAALAFLLLTCVYVPIIVLLMCWFFGWIMAARIAIAAGCGLVAGYVLAMWRAARRIEVLSQAVISLTSQDPASAEYEEKRAALACIMRQGNTYSTCPWHSSDHGPSGGSMLVRHIQL